MSTERTILPIGVNSETGEKIVFDPAKNDMLYGALMTAKVTIGWPGATDTDQIFASADNKLEQGLQLKASAFIPKFSRVLDIVIVCTEDFTGTAGDEAGLGCKIGSTSGGTEYAVSANVDDIDDINYLANGSAFTVAPSAAASSIYISATPTTNKWNELTAGKIICYIIYSDNNY